MLLTVLIVVFVVVIGTTWWFGLWSNFLSLVNVLLAGIVATGFYNNVAASFVSLDPSFKRMAPFIAFWGLFFLTVALLRATTDNLSKYRLKFHPVLELSGRTLLSLALGGILTSIVAFSLHLAPLAPSEFPRGGGNLGPDILWSEMAYLWSLGALSESRSSLIANDTRVEGIGAENNLQYPNIRPFSPKLFYSAGEMRRDALEQASTLRAF